MLDKFKKKKKRRGDVSLCLSLNYSFSLVGSSADSWWLCSSLLQQLCVPLAHWLSVGSAAFAPREADFTGQEPHAEGWQQALALLPLPWPKCPHWGKEE